MACAGQYIHRSFRWWMSNIDTCQSGLCIPLFTFCSKLIESEEDGMCGLTVTSWGKPAEGMCDCFYLRAIHSGSWDHNLYWGCTVFMADFGRKRCSGRDRVKRSLKPLNRWSQIKFHHSLTRISGRKSDSSPSWAGFKRGPSVFKAAYRNCAELQKNYL